MEKIAVDAMGGDFAPLEIVLGSIQAVREFKIPVVLVGDKEQILTILKNNHEENNPLIEIHHASEVIEMGEHPGLAYRKKKDASVSVGARLVRAKELSSLRDLLVQLSLPDFLESDESRGLNVLPY